MSFVEDAPPPFYDWEAPAMDTKVQKAKGKTGVKEGYVGKAKGMRQVLWERVWSTPYQRCEDGDGGGMLARYT